ncbi:MAG TPA: aspartate/glutamate racemase family protein [Ramlibacter sp.]|nr:aspartate/glutamate racemase family protein [Ramlibacter sp.]
MSGKLRLLLVNANTSEQVTHILAAAARAAAGPGTVILPRTAPRGVPVIQTEADHVIATEVCEQMVREGAPDCDAVLIGVSLDTALENLQRVCTKPVFGMTGAALAHARRSGRPVGVLTLGDKMKTLFCERFGPQAADHIHVIEMDPRTALEDRDRAAELLAQGVEALAARGAGIAIPIGATVAGLAATISRIASIQVLDSMGCAVQLAEQQAAARMEVRS